MYIDTHTHFDMCLENNELNEESLMANLKEAGIKYTVQVSTDIDNLQWSYDFSKKYNHVFFSAGIHPSSNAGKENLEKLGAFVQKVADNADIGRLFGIGETGLDYYRMHQSKDSQIESFEYQIDLANKFKIPLIVHSREALDDTLKILRRKTPRLGIMHCFSGNSQAAKEFLDLGFFISFAGNLTYPKAIDLHDSAKYVPGNRLLLETDAPFLTPVPLRGKKNISSYVIHTYKFISELRKETLTHVTERIYNNFKIIMEMRNIEL